MIKIASLLELFKPSEITKFKEKTQTFKTVDSRDTSWQLTLPELMAKYGFKPVGTGKFGSVFINPKYPYALKVFMRDTAYLKWLDFCKRNQDNKFVPKIKGKVVKVGKLFMAVRLEKLDEIKDRSGSPDDQLFRASENGDKDAIAVEKFLDQNAKLLDLHWGNVMSRNGQLVIIDPLYSWFRGGTYAIDPDDLSDFKSIL